MYNAINFLSHLKTNFYMKKLIMIMAVLFITVCTAQAQQLRINNNTGCDIEVDVYVWDVACSISSSVGPYLNYTIPAGQFLTFAGLGTTLEYQVDIIVDPGGANFAMPTISAAGICNANAVDSSPSTPCFSSIVNAATNSGSIPPNWEIDVF